ncbi:MAG: hypothetical protein ACRBFS_05665 [Aureispira sp.]
MKVGISLLLCFCGFFTSLLGQQELTARFPEQLKNKNYINYFLQESEGYLYTFSSSKKAYLLERYNKKTLLPETLATVTLPDKKANLEFVTGESEKAYVYYSITKKKKTILYAYSLDRAGMVVKEPQVIMEIDAPEDYGRGQFALARRSEDATKQLVYHHYPTQGKGYFSFYNQIMTLSLMDENLNIVNTVQKNFRGERQSQRRIYGEILLDAKDNWYISSANWHTSEDDHSNAYLYQYKVDDHSLKPIQSYELTVPGHYLEAPLVRFVEADKLVFLSLMSTLKVNAEDEVEEYIAQGFKGIEIDGQTAAVTKRFEEKFSKQQLEKFPAYKKEEQKPYQLTGWFQALDLLATAGGYYLVLEERTNNISYGYMENYSYAHETSYYQDVVACKLATDYSINWLSLLRKKQYFISGSALSPIIERHKTAKTSVSSGIGGGLSIAKEMRIFLSYTVVEKDGALYFVFVDSPKDLKGDPYNNGLQFNFGAETLATAVVKEAGVAKKKQLMKGFIRPRAQMLHQSATGKAYIMTRCKGNHSFLELSWP